MALVVPGNIISNWLVQAATNWLCRKHQFVRPWSHRGSFTQFTVDYCNRCVHSYNIYINITTWICEPTEFDSLIKPITRGFLGVQAPAKMKIKNYHGKSTKTHLLLFQIMVSWNRTTQSCSLSSKYTRNAFMTRGLQSTPLCSTRPL